MNDRDLMLHDVERGWMRLHHAPKDVRGTMPDYTETPDHIPCRPALTALHRLYLDDLLPAADQAVEWWSEIVEGHMEGDGSAREAAFRAYDGWPAGPAADETIVSVVRTYWLACVEQSVGLHPGEGMFPEDFLLATLDRHRHQRAILVLTAMPYWPIGLDENGKWC